MYSKNSTYPETGYPDRLGPSGKHFLIVIVLHLCNGLKFSGQLSHTYKELCINLLKPTGHVMHQQFDIQQLYVLPTLYLCVLYLSENKQRLVPLTA